MFERKNKISRAERQALIEELRVTFVHANPKFRFVDVKYQGSEGDKHFFALIYRSETPSRPDPYILYMRHRGRFEQVQISDYPSYAIKGRK